MSRRKPAPEIDVDELRIVLGHLRTAFDDLDFVTEDLLSPRRKRHWGYLTHVEKHDEAAKAIVQGLDVIARLLGIEPPPDDEPPWEQGDPSGNGGSPAH